ncbi:MAG: PDZ domain-containing protein [Bacteroidales bacterium]|nr:PDZ domain-containing protein [Bacteroidales bacterium]
MMNVSRAGIAVMVVSLTVGLTSAAEPAKSFPVPYRITDTKHILVRVKLNGTGPYNFILDTGAPSVFIPQAIAKKAGFTGDDSGVGTFKTFQLEGGLSLDGVTGCVEDLFQLEGMNGLGLAGAELHGVIGYNVLARYRITYDFTQDKLTWVPLRFEPPPLRRIGKGGQGGLEVLGPVMKTLASLMGVKPNFETRPRGSLGITIDETSAGVVVTSILPGSPAAQGGLQIGDTITEVAEHRVRNYAALLQSFSQQSPGERVTLQILRDRKPVTITVTLGKGF